MTEQTTLRAIDAYQKDARFRAFALSAVASALSAHGPIDPDHASQAAHDIALDAVVTLLQRVYEDDAELNTLRRERDAYKEQALRFASLAPPQPFVMPSNFGLK